MREYHTDLGTVKGNVRGSIKAEEDNNISNSTTV